MMTCDKFVVFVRQAIPDLLDKSGRILFTSYSSVSRARVYLMGFNPGGDPESGGRKTQ